MSAQAMQQLNFMVSLIDRVSGPAGKMMKTMDTVTTNIQGGLRKIGYGTAGIVGVGLAIDRLIAPAVKFESVMADVNKTVNFDSPDGLKEFSRDILEMTKILPITADGLGEIAAAGGRLGLDKAKLPDFVNVTAKMATAFDLQTDIAGEYAANLSNIYDIPIDKLNVLGDIINHLSDNTAAKAGDIIDVMQRTGGTGQQFGLATNQIAAMSAAMLSLGIPAEKSATAMNALFVKLLNIDKAGPKVQKVLKQMGMSGKELANNIQNNPQAALSDFLQKISGLSGKQGLGSLTAILGQNYAPTIALLTKSYDKYAHSLGLVGNQQNFVGSMEKEFQVRSKTTANLLVLMGNGWNRLMINMGNLILPRVIDVIGILNSVINPLSSGISSLSEQFPMLSTVLGWSATALVGVIAGVSLLSIAVGISKFAMIGFAPIVWLWQKALVGAALAQKGLNLAMISNPIGLMIAGLTAAIYYWDELKGVALGAINGIIATINLIPGINIPGINMGTSAAVEPQKPPSIPAALNTNANSPTAAGGGVINRISNASSTNNSRSIGGVTVNNYGQAMNGQQLADEMAFLAG